MISLFGLRINLDWFYNHADRDIIRRWTVGKTDESRKYELVIEGAEEPQGEWCFLVLGDTGDSARFGQQVSPQRAVATIMAQDCGLLDESPDAQAIPGAPALQPKASMVLHTGDINYLTGEQRLYDLNFIDPYRAFQTPESHYHNLTFRIPFMPVPGNHDYYDLHGWMGQIMKVSSWIGLGKPLTHFFYRLGLPVPFGGSEMGAAYMDAFVNQDENSPQPLPYKLGVSTRLPNRYYQFRRGNVHFFALDSNTLDAPPPGTVDEWKEKSARIVERSEKRLDRLNAQVEEDRNREQEEIGRQRTAMQAGEREELWPRLHRLVEAVSTSASQLSATTNKWADTLVGSLPAGAEQLRGLATQNTELAHRWQKIASEVAHSPQPVASYETQLDELISLQEAWLRHLVERDRVTVALPGTSEYEPASQARLALDSALGHWCRERVGEGLSGPCALPSCEEEEANPEEDDLEQVDLSEAILDTQRDLALARKLSDRRPEDYDTAQLDWLRHSLDAVKAEEAQNPENRIWRVVYLHHPLYTTMPSHAERGDAVGVRHNLEAILRDADVVIAGHSHGFEWLHSQNAPHQCYLVTGAGGQSRLQGSIFSPQLQEKYQPVIESLIEAGLDELVWASGDPVDTGATVENKLFSYLRIRVLPDELRIEPVGVLQRTDLEQEKVDTEAVEEHWERVYPMPVHEVADPQQWKGEEARQTQIRPLDHIKVRRGEPPMVVWAD